MARTEASGVGTRTSGGGQAVEISANGFGWTNLLISSASASFILFVVSAVALGDKEPIVFAALLVGGLLLVRSRRALWGAVVLGLVFANTALWMVPGALSTIFSHGPPLDLVLPAAHAATSLAGLVAVIGGFVQRHRSIETQVPLWVATAVLTLLGVTLIGNFVLNRGEGLMPRRGDVALRSDNTAFSDTTLTASPGRVTVFLSNGDLFWHTFTIDALDVDLKVPVGADRRVTFSASPGTYRFYCRIPGHALAGMHGTLTVR